MNTQWHLRVRAVICREGKILAVRTKNQSHSFLPGGHVEIGESTTVALTRELTEELGVSSKIENYLGAIENAWMESETRHWEITHFFHVTLPEVKNDQTVLPAEEGFDVIWITPDEFEKMNFLPISLRDLLSSWLKGVRKTWWASSM
jgi:ADP-ribose pyrophosphatase YjhB (NUDIX family)